IGISMFIFIREPNFKFKSISPANISIFLIFLLLLTLAISSLTNHSLFIKTNTMLTWLMILVSMVLTYYIISHINIDNETFYKYVYYFFLIYTLITIYIFNSFFGFSVDYSPLLIRNIFNEIGPGLNRYLNTYLLFFMLAYHYSFLTKSKLKKIIFIVCALFLIFITIITGSRQTLLGTILFILGYSVFISSERKLWFNLSILGITILFFTLFLNAEFGNWIYQRIIHKTINQSNNIYNSPRFYRYALSISFFFKHPFIGIGSGMFFKKTGAYVDSSY